jgi:hypothetical protein
MRALLCLMRNEDWTSREADMHVAEQVELRAALGPAHMADYLTVYHFPGRLDEVAEQALTTAIRPLPSPSEVPA